MTRLVAAAAVALVAAGCGLPGDTGQPDADAPPRPGPFDHWLEIEAIAPTTDSLSTEPTIYVEFNDYIEDDTFRTYDAGSLHSGGLSWGGWTDYVMTDKRLVWTARSSLPAGLDVTFRLADDFESVTGSPLREHTDLAKWRTAAHPPASNTNPLPSPTWSDVDAIFESHCTRCHGDPDWQLNPLTPDSLVGEHSTQVDRLLVRPYDPADSYLMQKLLWDYPLIRNSPQPPPWAGGEELPRRDLIVIEQWIANGAPGPSENPPPSEARP